MRVIQIIDSLEPGGAERVAVNLANALAHKIDKSFLCATRKEGLLKESINSDVVYLFLSKKGTFDLKAIFKLRTFLKKNNIDVVHAHSSSFFIAVLVKFFLFRVKIIWHDHYGNRDATSRLNKTILKHCSIFFSSIIAVNQKLKNRSKKKLLCKNVYALSNYPVVNLKPKVNWLEGLPNKRIVCLANLRPDKDHENLIKAFSKVKQIHPDWSLHLIGNYSKDLYFESITNLIKELQLENQVYIYGSCPDVFHILKQSTIGVLSSKSEGLPLALLEYGVVGLPSIATNVGDCNIVISNKREGVLIESEDVNALKNALLSLIIDEKLRQNMGARLKDKVVNNFSEEVQINKLIEIYKLHIK